MLSHQRWPYVGRFARGWHRLPGRIPGQPQTRTRARLRIGSPCRTAQRPAATCDRACRGDRVNLPRARLHEHVGGRGERRPGREHVVDDEDARRRGTGGPEHAVHRHPALDAGTTRLWRGRDRSAELPPRGTIGAAGDRDGEGARLVVSALGATGSCQRHPRDDVDVGNMTGARDRIGERRSNVSPAGELEPKDRATRRPVVHERRTHRRERRRWAILTRRLWAVGRVAAPFTPWGLDRTQPGSALRTERPRTRAAPRARPWEQGVGHAREHGATLPAATDTTEPRRRCSGYGKGTSTGGSPLTWIVSARSERSTGYPVRTPRPVSSSKSASRIV